MKIKFNVKFATAFGQNIYITGSCNELGNWNKENAIGLKYDGGSQWSVDLDINEKKFDYLYFIKDQRNSDITEEWARHQFELPTVRKQIVIYDTWNYPSLPEFNLNTAFFEHLAPKFDVKKVRKFKKNSHRFSIPFRILNPNEAIYLLGNFQNLGNWEENQALKLNPDHDGRWFVDVDLSQAEGVIEYKYLIKDSISGQVKYYETGNNRYVLPTQNDEFALVNDVSFGQPQQQKWKGSGVAVPVFSLRSEKGLGVGEFLDLIDFGKWAKNAGFSMIQILPIHDTTAKFDWTDSYPYAAISVYALHPMYLRLSDLKDLSTSEIQLIASKSNELNQHAQVDYEEVNQFKNDFLQKYFNKNFEKISKNKSFLHFLDENSAWVKPYAAFSVLRDSNKTADFTQWKTNSKSSAAVLNRLFKSNSKQYKNVLFYVFVQWQLHEQLSKTVDALHDLKLTLKGDLPIGIYRHSADAWWNPELFHMDQQAGAPPDDFAVLGQNWEFPTYNWDKMKEDDFGWWKSRFQFMSRYFDAFRIDHILGFFRIWQIPMTATQGILGRFEPALPVTWNELHNRGIHLDLDRLTQPYIHYDLLFQYFGSDTENVILAYFEKKNDAGEYKFKSEYDSQRKIQNILGTDHAFTARLLELAANVLFIKEEGEEILLHPRFAQYNTNNYKWLGKNEQDKLYALYLDYFYHRQEEFWRQKGLEKLPALKQATNMLTCGEDLGMVPKVVPMVMNDLAILSLQVQRMPSDEKLKYSHPKHAPYLSVVSPSSHDTSTLRQWWKENSDDTQYYFNQIMGIYGQAPYELHPDLQAQIIDQHLYSPAMLSVIPLQEFLGMSQEFRNSNEDIERINIPAVFPHYWRYRMHVNISELANNDEFTQRLLHKHQDAKRG
ncbi:MAG: 4-alpha-glucanotransferase [Flavobacteriaceae bacterium]|nr:4-alpha-glucanotransferase [Flavobacteriaceae bacterium]